MKKKFITLTIVCLLGVSMLLGQNAGVSGFFTDTPIVPGQVTQLNVDIIPDFFNPIATGDLEIVISFPAGGEYVNDYVTPPAGELASSFDWTPGAATKTWYGINNQVIPAAINGGGGIIMFDVTGVHNNTLGITTLEVTLVGDINAADDNATPSLMVPVKLSSFDIKSSDCNTVTLEWVTEIEQSNKGFELERSTDNRDFKKIGFVAARDKESDGRYHYGFVDSSVENDNRGVDYYYRLVQVDLDGKKNIIGSVLSANLDCQEELSATIYPIPAYNKLTYKLSNNYLAQNVDIKIFSNAGQMVYKGTVEHVSLLENDIDVSKFPVGLYQIRFTSDTSTKEYKFMKMK